MSEKLSIFSPSIATTRSPGWKPAACAALAGCTVSTRALVVCLPTIAKTPAKMTIARMKLATGPATTTAARGATGLWTKLTAFSSSLMAAAASWSGTLAALSSPKNLT
jgi:hypothetical protein